MYIAKRWGFTGANQIQSVLNLKPPSNIKELCSFLSMITYCAKFIPQYVTIRHCLQRLVQKGK